MDNVTHSLTGLALSRAGLDRFCPRAVWLLLLSANAPDVDIVVAPQGAFRYLEVHRGYTHSLIVMPFLAALAVVVVAAISRKRLPWLRAWLLCVAGLASHLLLDWTNSYGVRLCLPFSSRWFHLDLNSLFDTWILAVLLFAAIWPVFSRLVNREIGEQRAPTGRPIAIFALVFFALFDIGRAALHNRALAELESRLYDGLPPIQAAALPDPFNPLRWTAVVETPGTFRLSTIDPLGQLNLEDAATFYKPPVTPSLEAARRIDPFRYFLYFSRFPAWSIMPLIGATTRGTRLDLTDLRFGTPGSGSFHCVAYENQLNQVIEKRFTYGSGADLGWHGTRGEEPGQ
jgi:inner membrane protein